MRLSDVTLGPYDDGSDTVSYDGPGSWGIDTTGTDSVATGFDTSGLTDLAKTALQTYAVIKTAPFGNTMTATGYQRTPTPYANAVYSPFPASGGLSTTLRNPAIIAALIGAAALIYTVTKGKR